VDTSPALDADWQAAIRATFTPLQVSERLWVVPDWDEPPDGSAVNVRLQPGLAFGTGEHATTRLCLCWLQATLAGGETLCDYGCGSGVLALGGLLLGAQRAIGCDTDPVAVSAAVSNAELNGVAARFQACEIEPGIDAPPPPSLGEDATYDVVVANILVGPLLELRPRLTQLVRPGGALALSGLLASQAADVIAAYQPHFELPMRVQTDGEWALVHGRRL
jgi:ribosomal protein L11 methyltransferase